LPLLKEKEVNEALAQLPEWYLRSNAIRRDFEFKDFAKAMVFVNQVAEIAETANHHPDIDIRYNKVTLALTSHDSGGITKRDVNLAHQISDFYKGKARP
jgi:4a-hydroxytetrahydrobiopterin dehydratase